MKIPGTGSGIARLLIVVFTMVAAKLDLLVTLVLFIGVLQVTEGGLNGKLVSMLKKKADLCTKEQGVSLSQKEQMDLVAQKCPKTETGKKAMACIVQKVGVVNEECQIVVDGVKQMSKKYGRNKNEKEKMLKAGDICKTQVAKKVTECGPNMEAVDVICKCMMGQKMF